METKAIIILEKEGTLTRKEISLDTEALPHTSLFHIIISSRHCRKSLAHLPDEIITHVAFAHRPFWVREYDGSGQVICYINSGQDAIWQDDSSQTTQAVLSVFNTMPDKQLIMILPQIDIKRFAAEANQNILFYSFETWDRAKDTSIGLVIASGSIAVNFLLYKYPVIVAGVNGMGGLVTTANLQGFIDNDFQGRIGGTVGEPIPMGLLSHEIFLAELGAPETNTVPLQAKLLDSLQSAFYDQNAADKIETIFLRCVQQFDDLKRGDMQNLRPLLSSRIKVIPDQEEDILLINSGTNHLVATIGQAEYALLKYCDGKTPLAEICHSNGIETDADFHDFINQLFIEKILVFPSSLHYE